MDHGPEVTLLIARVQYRTERKGAEGYNRLVSEGAQGFPDTYDLLDGELTQVAQIRLAGNSVCPPVAAALVRANVGVRSVTRRPAPHTETEARP